MLRKTWLWLRLQTELHPTQQVDTSIFIVTVQSAQFLGIIAFYYSRFLSLMFIFLPINLFSADDGDSFIREIGRRATLRTSDPRETTFLYQRISIAVQRFRGSTQCA